MPKKSDRRLAAARSAILDAALARVPAAGWSRATLAVAAEDAGIDAPLAARAFPKGAADVVAAFHERCDSDMAAAFATRDLATLRYRDRVGLLVRLRIEAMAPHFEAARMAVAFHALPGNAPYGARCLARTADAIWRAVGDTSTDFSYYTKRATLMGVLASTTLVWLDDEDGAATWEFLDRRLGDVVAIGRVRARVQNAAGAVFSRATTVARAGLRAVRTASSGIRPASSPRPHR